MTEKKVSLPGEEGESAMGRTLWTFVSVAVVVAAGCGKREEMPRAPAGPPASDRPPAAVAAEPVPERPAAEAEAAEKEVLFSEDFESGEVGRWTSITIVEGGAGGSKYAAQGTVAEGRNPEYWGLDLVVDDALTLSLDIFFEAPVTELQVMTFAKNSSNNFRFQQADLAPGRWHHIEAGLADFFSWDGGSLRGDTIQSINIWVQGTAGDAFRVDNIVLSR